MITSTLDIAGLDGGRVQLTAAQLGDLRARVQGPIPQAGDDGGQAAVQVWNSMIVRTEIKKKYDPRNLFRVNRNIRPGSCEGGRRLRAPICQSCARPTECARQCWSTAL